MYRKEEHNVKRTIFVAAMVLVLCLAGCKEKIPYATSGPATVPTQPTTVTTQPPETTMPVETTEPVVMSVSWREDLANRFLYTYEDYFAFERFFRIERGAVQDDLYAKEGYFFPFAEEGKLYLKDQEETVIFQVGEKTYTNLRVFGTDGYYWTYCVEDGKELFRIDPYGNQESLFVDETGRIGYAGGYEEDFRIEDNGNMAWFTAGTPEGYGIYRIHLPSKQVDVMVSREEPIRIGVPRSNYQLIWSFLDDETIYTTPGKEWDLSDPAVQKFQKLLEPGEDKILKGVNNWYNDATGVFHESPEAVSLFSLFGNGFRDLSTKLTDEELAALGSAANADKEYYKLPGDRVDQLLQKLYGLTREALEKDTLLEEGFIADVLYDSDADIYYYPCYMNYNYGEKDTIYIWKVPLTVHLVEEKDDGTIWVYYIPFYPNPFGSDTGDEENVMVLKKVGSGYQILSNGRAVYPMES